MENQIIPARVFQAVINPRLCCCLRFSSSTYFSSVPINVHLHHCSEHDSFHLLYPCGYCCVNFVVDADPRGHIDFQGKYNTDHYDNKFRKAHQVSLSHHQDIDYKAIME
jgi:hypothetical protein